MLDRSLTRLDGMRKLILDLLDLTRIESGQKQRELAAVDLREVGREARSRRAAQAARRAASPSTLHAPETRAR